MRSLPTVEIERCLNSMTPFSYSSSIDLAVSSKLMPSWVREIFRVFLYSKALLRFFSSLDKCVLAVAVVRPNAAAPPEIEPRSTILANTIR